MATKRAKEIRAGLKENKSQGGLDYLVDEMVAKRPVLASYVRDGIDRLGYARNALILDGKYAKLYERFRAAVQEHDFKEKGKLEFEGSKYSEEAAAKMTSTIRVKGEEGPTDTKWGGDTKSERFKYRALGETKEPIMGKLFKDLPRTTEMGHQSLSILIGQMALLLKKLRAVDPDDGRIPHLKALLLVCKAIDKLSEEADLSLEGLVKLEQTVLESEWDVGAEAEAIVDAFTGVKGEVLFTMEPTELNQDLKSTLAQELGRVFQDVVQGDGTLANQLFTGYDITNLKGSPSIAQHIGAQIYNILDPEGRPKKAKVTPKPSNKKTTLGTAKPKRRKSSRLAPIKLTRPKKAKAKTKPSKVSLTNMLGMINAKLPGTVLDNMGAPGLESRTGRFAQSVRATEIIRTRKGFPSIGYLYQKDPYQVYETTSGTRFSDAGRDPRKLIDLSIREIAGTMAIGRLYTRRV